MANVCRPLQNGLPAPRCAVIRRALELLLLELGSEPARVVFRSLASRATHDRRWRRMQTAAWAFPIRPLSLAVCAQRETLDVNAVERPHDCALVIY